MKRLLTVLFVVLLLAVPSMARATTYFTANGSGQILQPNGQVWQGRGMAIAVDPYNNNITALANLVTNASAQPLTTLFPKINYVRLAINLSNYACAPYNFSIGLPASFAQQINILTSLGIVVIIDQHAFPQANSDYSVSCSVQTGSALQAEQAWYQQWANYFLTNPYVWFQTPNEPVWGPASSSQAPVTAEQVAIYQTIRGTGNNSILVLETIGGGDTPYLGANCADGLCLTPLSAYTAMSNVVWDYHAYAGAWTQNGQNGTQVSIPESVISPQLAGMVSLTQTIPTGNSGGNGTAAVLIGEFGPSNSGTGYDLSGLANIQAVFDSGNSSNAWVSCFCAPNPTNTDGLLDNTGALTTNYGTYVAAWTAANPCCGSAKQRVPAPLVGTVTTQSWTAQDVSFTTAGGYPYSITLTSGRPFHFNVLPPAQYNPNSYIYPLLIWLHPDFDQQWYSGNNQPYQLVGTGFEAASFNTVSFLTAYPAVIAVPYADQTCGNDAVCNWGGWFNNGSVGSGSVFSGDTGPNTFAVIDMVQWLEANYSIDPSRIYVEGFSLGGIGSEYMMLLYNQVNGNPKVFAAGASMAGVLQVNGFGAGPTTANANTMQNVPVWWFSGANDTNSVPSQWNNPIATDLGASSYPSAITSIAANKIGNSQMEYTLCPTCGHQDQDAGGNPVWTNTTIMSWMFGINGGGGGCTSNCTPSGTTWDPNTAVGGIVLSNNNLTAISNVAAGQGVRSTTSKTSGKACAQVTLVALSTNMAVGIDNASDVLSGYLGGGPSLGIGMYQGYGSGQQIFQSGSAIASGTAGTSSPGEVVTIELDATAGLVWFTDTKMQSGGYTWNNSTTANPETGTGGLSTTGFGGPYFIAANTQDASDNWLFNPTPTSGCTASFPAWQQPVVTAHHPIIFSLF